MRTTPFLTAGVLALAFLSPAPAAAAGAPVTAAGCSATETGVPGEQEVLAPASETAPVVSALAGLDPLGVLTGTFRTVWAGAAPIPVGTVPEDQAEIPGTRIADAVVTRLGELPVLAPVLAPLVATVRTSLGSLCGILVRGRVPGEPPSESAAAPAPPAAPGGAPGGVPGGGAVFGTPIPGQLPGAGFPAGAEVPQAGGQAPVVLDARRSAGSAEALAAPRGDALSWPVLAGILLLAAVSAQLVRRWGLRRTR